MTVPQKLVLAPEPQLCGYCNFFIVILSQEQSVTVKQTVISYNTKKSLLPQQAKVFYAISKKDTYSMKHSKKAKMGICNIQVQSRHIIRIFLKINCIPLKHVFHHPAVKRHSAFVNGSLVQFPVRRRNVRIFRYLVL